MTQNSVDITLYTPALAASWPVSTESWITELAAGADAAIIIAIRTGVYSGQRERKPLAYRHRMVRIGMKRSLPAEIM